MFKSSHKLTLALACIGLVAIPLLAQQSWPRISESYRHYCFDFNWVDKLDREGAPLSDYSEMSAQEHVRHLQEMNANALMVFCMSISGYTFFDSEVGTRHPSLDYDYLKEMVELGHKAGISMEMYVPTIWADHLIIENPSWGARNPDGTLFQSAYGGYHPDPNSPAADWYESLIKEIFRKYDGDGFFADGLSFLRYGQSEFTVKKFKEEMGRDYPTSLEEDPDWRETLRWELQQVEAYWDKIRNAVKSEDPSAEVTFNGPGPTIKMPGQTHYRNFVPTPPHLNQRTDYAFTEAGSSGEYATWTRAVSEPNPFKVTFLNQFSVLDPFDADIMRARVGRTLAEGGLPYRYDRTSVDGVANEHFTKTWAEIFAEVEKKEPYVKGAWPTKYIAVVTSEPTMMFRGRADWGSHSDDLIGALKLLDSLHLQHDVLADWNVTPQRLRDYQLVILPNVSCMSDEEIDAIRSYVAEGGKIVATAETSLLREDATLRSDFGLADVLGITLDEAPSNDLRFEDTKPPVYLDPSRSDHPVFRSLPQTELVLPGDSTYVKAVGGDATVPLVEDAGTPMRSPAAETDHAVVHINEFGKGEAVYISGSIFARSFERSGFSGAGNPNVAEISEGPGIGVRWVGPFVQALVQHLAPSPPWTLGAPPQIWAGLNHQEEKNRHVLHLVNSQPKLPARELLFQVHQGSRVGSQARVVWPKEQSLEARDLGGSHVFTIPEVAAHTIVTFE